jgi:protein-S-isoprenylcysteine O-methyltransferase Ste14
MRTSTAGVSTAVFFLTGPPTVVGLIPWLISRWEIIGSGPAWRVAQVCGVLLIIAGLIAVAHASVQFAKAGGAPMPMALTQRLVVNGFHRYVRNPMYVGLLIAIMGQALLFGSLDLLVYAGVLWIIMAAFVHWYK